MLTAVKGANTVYCEFKCHAMQWEMQCNVLVCYRIQWYPLQGSSKCITECKWTTLDRVCCIQSVEYSIAECNGLSYAVLCSALRQRVQHSVHRVQRWRVVSKSTECCIAVPFMQFRRAVFICLCLLHRLWSFHREHLAENAEKQMFNTFEHRSWDLF